MCDSSLAVYLEQEVAVASVISNKPTTEGSQLSPSKSPVNRQVSIVVHVLHMC